MAPKLKLSLGDDDPWDVEQQIFDVVANYVQPDSTQIASDAADALDRLLPMHRDVVEHGTATSADADDGPESPGSFVWYMWGVFHKIAQQLPPVDAAATTAQDRLAELVRTLRRYTSRTPVVDLDDWGSGVKLWQDLPLWGPTFREVWDREF
jgi:hypothetical protein